MIKVILALKPLKGYDIPSQPGEHTKNKSGSSDNHKGSRDNQE